MRARTSCAQTRILADRSSSKSGLTKTHAVVNGKPRPLRRYIESRLFLQVMNIVREDDIDWSLVSDELEDVLSTYRSSLREKSYFDFTGLLATAVDLPEEDESAR